MKLCTTLLPTTTDCSDGSGGDDIGSDGDDEFFWFCYFQSKRQPALSAAAASQSAAEPGSHGRTERCTTVKSSKHTEKSELRRTEITTHSDTEWKPDHDSEECASSGGERILAG